MPELNQTATSTEIRTIDRPLPHNDEAEVAVLGSMLIDPAVAIDTAASKLNFDGSFYSPQHQQIFRTLLQLGGEKSRGSIDLITLSDALERAGHLDEVGGRSYLNVIMNSVPTAANIEQYVDIVHQNAILRRLIRASAEIVEHCYDPSGTVEELLDDVEQRVFQVTSLNSSESQTLVVGELILEAINYLDQLHSKDKSVLGIQTGYDDLDRLITGLRAGEMMVLAARPSIGKTALALNIAENIALGPQNTPIGIFSLEMSADLLVLRLLCSRARVSISDIREGALSNARWQEIMEAGQLLKRAPVYIDDSGGLDIMELRARARRMKRESDIKLLIIDYLQLVRTSDLNRNATRENEVARISGRLKSLAKELSVPVVVLAQLNRQAEQAGQRPKLGHLRESGAIEQDADLVALLHRERELDNERGSMSEGMDAELIIAKHRNGPTGIVPLTFFPAYTRFENRARIADEDVPDI